MEKIVKTVLLHVLVSMGLLCHSGCQFKKTSPAELPDNIPVDWSFVPATGDLTITSSLLDLFRDDQLETLVKETLKNNPDLKATAFRLKASELLLARTRSQLMPSARVHVNRSRDNQGIDPVTGKRMRQNHYTAGLNMGWEIDIWGRLANEHEVYLIEHEIRNIEMIAAYDSLASRVIKTWITIAGTQELIELAHEKIRLLSSIESTIQRRYQDGLGKLNELSTARTRNIISQSRINHLIENKARAIRELNILSGKNPNTQVNVNYRFVTIKNPVFPPPALVLGNRPDIKAAISQVDSEMLRALAAKKKLLPQINLSFDLTKRGSSFSSLKSGDVLWNLVAGIVQPVFQGERLLNASKAAALESDASVQNLKTRVLKAIKEVEDGAGLEAEYREEETYLLQALKEAQNSTVYFQNRYRKGLVSILDLLFAIEQEMNVKTNIVNTRISRMVNRVNLALALGMGC